MSKEELLNIYHHSKTTKERLQKLKLPTLRYRRLRGDMIRNLQTDD